MKQQLEFKQGEIPEGWEEVELKLIIETIENGSRPTGGVDFQSGEIPSLGGENIIQDGGVKYFPVKKIFRNFFDSLKRGVLKDKDVLINKDGANTGKSGLYSNIHYSDAAINEHLFLLRGKKERIIQDYLYYYIVSEMAKRKIELRITGSAQPGLNSQFVNNFYLNIPKSIKEQEKIALILQEIDNSIEGTQKVINKYNKIKNGLVQDLFKFGLNESKLTKKELNSHEYEFPEDWLIKNVGKSSTLKGRIGWQGLTTQEYLEEGDYFLITGTDFKDGKVAWNTCHFVKKYRYDQDKNIQVKIKDILITKDGTIGKIAFVNSISKPTTLNSGVFVLRPQNNSYNPEFMYHILMSSRFDRFIENLKAGSTISHLYQKDFVNFEFTIPKDPEEQKRIADILTSADNKIESEEKYLNKLIKIKRGLIQDLLTGKVRVKVEK